MVATSGAGGDVQPLIAAALALRSRGHEILFVADDVVEQCLAPVDVEVALLPPELDLAPRLAGAIDAAMESAGGDLAAAGTLVRDEMSRWAREVANPVAESLRHAGVDAAMTSLFGLEVFAELAPTFPWAVINSTFYVGPGARRPLELDFAPRAVPLFERFTSLLDSPSLVLHATDQIFDFAFDELPPRHRYVGPLGIWEPPARRPEYLDAPGDPWVLVSISSAMQDDLPLVDAALVALADQRVRVLATIGPDHDPAELSPQTSNEHVERTVPHSAVLRRGKLLVSHAGHGSVMKALWYGRPMVLVPWGRDQPGVAERAQALGVAVVILREHTSSEALRDAIGRVLSDNQMRGRAAEHAARLQSMDPPLSAALALETLL